MKKINLIFIFLLNCFCRLYSFSIYDNTYCTIHPAIDITFYNDGTGIISHIDGRKLRFSFETKNTNFITTIELKTDISKFYSENWAIFQKVDYFILLTGKEIYKGTERNFSVSFLDTNYPFIYFMPGQMEGYCSYKDCTSYLIEGDKKYSIDNLSEIRIDSPWVEGVPGNGEGEGFTIEGSAPYLLIVNGFISVKKPYLYEMNSRVKTLKVTGSKSGNTKVLDVLDTPNPQTVDISFLDKEDDTIVRIDSVYEGSKYQDTCISLCKLYGKMVIPYLGED